MKGVAAMQTSKKITESNLVGKVDWELTKFHGDELSTRKGSSYNSTWLEMKVAHRHRLAAIR